MPTPLILGFQTEYFPPDPSSNATLYGRLVEHISPRFARMDVVTAGPHGDLDATSPPTFTADVRVRRCPPPSWSMRRSVPARFASELWFSVRNSWLAARSSSDWDVLLSSTPPLVLGGGATLVARVRRIPSIWWVQDLHPEIAVALGVASPQSISFRLLHSLHAWILRCASIVITVSEAQRQALLEAYPKVPPDRVVVLENPAAHQAASNPPEGGNHLTITYTGNLGLSQGLEHVVHVADRVRSLPVRFVIHGRGTAEPEVRALVDRLDLDNVSFSSFVDDREYLDLLRRSDVLLLSLRPGIDRYSFPSKLWTYMTAGRPILACVGRGGAVEETLAPSGAGIVTTWGDVEGAVTAVKELLDADRRSSMGAAAARFNAGHLTPEDHGAALAKLISGAVEGLEAARQGPVQQ
jgi:glycosyltransferase involved in cell wall biosynthesis